MNRVSVAGGKGSLRPVPSDRRLAAVETRAGRSVSRLSGVSGWSPGRSAAVRFSFGSAVSRRSSGETMPLHQPCGGFGRFERFEKLSQQLPTLR